MDATLEESLGFAGRSHEGPPPVAWKRRALGVVLGLAALGVQRVAAGVPDWVEGVWVPWIYRPSAEVLAFTSGLLPVSLSELLLLLGSAALLVGLVRRLADWRRGRLGLGALSWRAASFALAAAGWLYALFVLLWGLGHARPALAELAGWRAAPAEVAELEDWLAELVAAIEGQRPTLAEDENGLLLLADDGSVREALLAGYAALESRLPAISLPGAARPRAALLTPVLARFGISGIYSPFTAEPHYAGDLPAASRAFTQAHELAHLAGFAREDEANFLGAWAALSSSDPRVAYAGLLAAYRLGLSALGRHDPSAAGASFLSLPPGAQRDLAAADAYWQARRSVVTEVGTAVNDAYLKSQGRAEGVRSYGRAVDLFLAQRRARLASEG